MAEEVGKDRVVVEIEMSSTSKRPASESGHYNGEREENIVLGYQRPLGFARGKREGMAVEVGKDRVVVEIEEAGFRKPPLQQREKLEMDAKNQGTGCSLSCWTSRCSI